MINHKLATLMTDTYKLGHQKLYPKNLTKIYSVLIPRRNSYFPWSDEMIAFGYHAFVQKELVENFQENFFNVSLEDVKETMHLYISQALGPDVADDLLPKFVALHELGYLPLRIDAVPEGTLIPMNVPVLTIENTHDDFAWLPGYLETILLSDTFVTATSATIAYLFRSIGYEWAKKTSDSDESFLDFQFHDFSQRGQHGNDAMLLSGMGHLAAFRGTDAFQATGLLANAYSADMTQPASIGGSVLASEHSVMETYGTDDLTTFRELLTNNPTGILSLVSDTYDYYNVINNVLPELKDLILSREGKTVVRPDSGDMVTVIIDTLNSLWETFGGTINSKGYKVLDPHVGLLHGEGITLDNVDSIFKAMADAGFSSENIVLGLGAYVYSVNNSRDSFGHAMKAQLAVIDGEEVQLYKDPKTDTSHLKRSLKGGVSVEFDGDKFLHAVDNLTRKEANDRFLSNDNWLRTIFFNGVRMNVQSLEEVRDQIKIEAGQ